MLRMVLLGQSKVVRLNLFYWLLYALFELLLRFLYVVRELLERIVIGQAEGLEFLN